MVGEDMRFYGRGAKGNRILSQGEIESLYRRRAKWEQDREELLDEALNQMPFAPSKGLAYLIGFARPVAPDRAIWDRAVVSAEGRGKLQDRLCQAAAKVYPNHRYAPTFSNNGYWSRRGADEWLLSPLIERDKRDLDADDVVDVRINIDGRGHLFCGRAAEGHNRMRTPDQAGDLIIFEGLIAGNSAAFLGTLGALYEAGGYRGQVDIGFAVTGLRGALSNALRMKPPGLVYADPYEADSYPRTAQVAAGELLEPEPVVGRMFRHLFEATTGREDYNPFNED